MDRLTDDDPEVQAELDAMHFHEHPELDNPIADHIVSNPTEEQFAEFGLERSWKNEKLLQVRATSMTRQWVEPMNWYIGDKFGDAERPAWFAENGGMGYPAVLELKPQAHESVRRKKNMQG